MKRTPLVCAAALAAAGLAGCGWVGGDADSGTDVTASSAFCEQVETGDELRLAGTFDQSAPGTLAAAAAALSELAGEEAPPDIGAALDDLAAGLEDFRQTLAPMLREAGNGEDRSYAILLAQTEADFDLVGWQEQLVTAESNARSACGLDDRPVEVPESAAGRGEAGRRDDDG